MEHQFPLLGKRRGKPTSVGGVVDFAKKSNHLVIRQPAEATPPNQEVRNWLGGEIRATYFILKSNRKYLLRISPPFQFVYNSPLFLFKIL
jgi:hypothetical protein